MPSHWVHGRVRADKNTGRKSDPASDHIIRGGCYGLLCHYYVLILGNVDEKHLRFLFSYRMRISGHRYQPRGFKVLLEVGKFWSMVTDVTWLFWHWRINRALCSLFVLTAYIYCSWGALPLCHSLLFLSLNPLELSLFFNNIRGLTTGWGQK